jgi:hypothetical protein
MQRVGVREIPPLFFQIAGRSSRGKASANA